MDEMEFEGTLVLEKLAEINLIDEFFAAIDNDDFTKAKSLMLKADLDDETIQWVLTKMKEASDSI